MPEPISKQMTREEVAARTIKLDPGEVEVCRMIGELRFAANREANVEDEQKSDGNPIDQDIDGIGAEYATAKFLNVCPDLTTTIRAGGHDMIWHKNTIDVKSTRHLAGQLLLVPGKIQDLSDLYWLTTIRWPFFFMCGHADGKTLTAEERLDDMGQGPVYTLTQPALGQHHIESIIGKFDVDMD